MLLFFFEFVYLLGLLFFSLDGTLILRHDALRAHTDCQALLKPALLALSTHVHVDFAGLAVLALINRIFRYATPEEALAALACEGVVVIARSPVPANEAQFLLLPWRRALFLLGIAAVRAVPVDRTRRWQVFPSWNTKQWVDLSGKILQITIDVFICLTPNINKNKRV